MKTEKDLAHIFEYMSAFITPERLEKINHYAEGSSDFILPVLEDVYQYRNAAAIIRSVEACGFHKVVALEQENLFEPNLSVTKGADTWVEVEKMPRNKTSLEQIRQRGYKIVAVSPERDAIMLPDYELKEPIALVFGTEWEGASDELLEMADETLAIPMYGFTNSFNVSVAAAICMYELKQKLLKSTLNYRLSEEKKWALKIRWATNSARSGAAILKQKLSTE
ncbi:TrmH family RNA methyltransferase [Riemerella columbina]|uniref:TrmH family RNA methyltransferase n=1 Tax=Riemerella columbina TaxID=103810 RepID=UPI00266F6599|nr:RNA methyltransferase [Riemerella columbina]WKS96005.1 RNA methyltransferase [Riemerella columbina]